MARRRRETGRWRPARRQGRMIEYDEDGRYLRHVSIAEYEWIRDHQRELRHLIRDGFTVARAIVRLGADPTGALIDLAADLLLED